MAVLNLLLHFVLANRMLAEGLLERLSPSYLLFKICSDSGYMLGKCYK